MARLLPEPSTGLNAAWSGVEQPQPKEPGCDGSAVAPCPYPLVAPLGFAKLGWLKMLNVSMRNCALRRSPNLKFLLTERSTLWKPVSLKMLRPILPNVPKPFGIKTEFPTMEQKPFAFSAANVLAPTEVA